MGTEENLPPRREVRRDKNLLLKNIPNSADSVSLGGKMSFSSLVAACRAKFCA
jgi:hypothetical protein